MKIRLTTIHMLKPVMLLCVGAVGTFGFASNVIAAIAWDGGGGTNWWFNPVNWSRDADAGGPFLPPSQGQPVVNTDAQINIGTTGAWNVTGEGVVYDPDNDPYFDGTLGDPTSLAYPTGSPLSGIGYGDYGPQHLYRMYIGRNVTDGSTNLLTMKSGDLVVAGTYVIGRSGSTTGMENLGVMIQQGGRFRIPLDPLDIGQAETAGWGNGKYEYQGGTLEIGIDGLDPIRLAHGGGNGVAGGTGTFVVHNPTSGGYVRGWAYQSASYRGSGDGVFTEGADPDGIGRGVAITEFHYENGGTRPIQIGQSLSINNGFQADTGGTTSSRLDLILHEPACAGAACVPNNIGLFDVDFDLGFGSNGGVIVGSGDKSGFFSSIDGSVDYTQGATVSAMFGGVRYDWTISYQGDITWTNADNSVVGSVSGTGGVDVVLIGLGSEAVGLSGDFDGDGDVDGRDFLIWQRGNSPIPLSAGDLSDWQTNYGSGSPLASFNAVPEPSSLILLCAAALPLFARRR